MKLLSFNTAFKINNSQLIANLVDETNAEVVCLQELARHFEDSVYEQYKSKSVVDSKLKDKYIDDFYSPQFCSRKFLTEDGVTLRKEFGGLVEQGLQIYSKYPIISAESIFYFKNYAYAISAESNRGKSHGRCLQRSTLNIEGKEVQIINIHGVWTSDKLDSQEKYHQTEVILNIIENSNLPTILVGDFNLLPETESIKLLNSKLRNLCTEYKVESTRPNFDDGTDIGNVIVDYIFVTPEIKVNSFKVIETNISDHYPLEVDFDLIL